MANTIIYKEDWEANLQKNLSEATYWKDTARVDYTDTYTLNNPYKNRSTVSAYTKGAQYTFADATITQDSVSLDTVRIIPEFIDEADLSIAGYDMQMELAEDQARAIDEAVETVFLGAYSQGTTFDGPQIGAGAGDITLTTANVDDVIRGARRELMEGRGFEMYNRMGATFLWRPVDFEKAVAYAQTQGFRTADEALTGGRVVNYGGFIHRETNLLTVETSTAHSIAMVNGAIHMGIFNGTYGKVKVNTEDPNLQSGVGIVSRVDMKAKVWNTMSPLVLDVTIAE